jgi:hypothetical protein
MKNFHLPPLIYEDEKMQQACPIDITFFLLFTGVKMFDRAETDITMSENRYNKIKTFKNSY